MNLHMPQSIAAATEIKYLASVLRQIISPRTNSPIIHVFQDTQTGAYRISQKGVEVPEHIAMNIMSRMKKPISKYVRKNKPISGQEIISTAFPIMNMNGKITLKDGQLTKGLLSKSVFGGDMDSLTQTIYNDFGPQRAGQFINDIQNIVTKFNLFTGFSVGASDLIADSKTSEMIKNTIAEKKKIVADIISSVHSGTFVNETGRLDGEELENRIMKTLRELEDVSNKIVSENISNENRILQMVKSGSKGSGLNITQMMANLGQQFVAGKRVIYTLQDRTLPHFAKYDDGAESRGFVENSFIEGIRPAEFFFHAMGGREGLIDTAVKTSDSGYIQRKLVKTLEDLSVSYDGTVRNVNGSIIQFRYGGDGIDSTSVEAQECELGVMTMEDIYKNFGSSKAEFEMVCSEDVNEEDMIDQILEDREVLVRDILRFYKNSTVKAPVNLKRLVEKYTNPFATKTNLTPKYVVQELNKLCGQPWMLHNKLFHILLRYNFAPKKSIIAMRMSKDMFDELLKEIQFKYLKAVVHAGEMVGTIGAQSIGEPTTQLTLNSVDWDEEIIIAKNGQVWTPKIGEFIDEWMEKHSNDVQHLENDQLYLELNDGNDWKAISCDENGVMKWTKLEAITKHPVVNEDGSSTILKVETESGRIVKATKGKSFLTVVDGKIVGKNGSELKIGDELPISNDFAIDQLPQIKSIPLREILSAKEWLYGTDVENALSIMKFENSNGNKYWWKSNADVNFVLPYKQSDSFRDAFVNGHNGYAEQIKGGYVYQKFQSSQPTQIPDNWELTSELGFFIGAYLAEGNSNATQVMITNADSTYLEKVKSLMDSWEVGTHIVNCQKQIENTGIRGTTQSLVIHSTLIAKVMSTLFGRVSYEKKIPDWIYQAPDDFVKGLVDGYISGDGTIGLDYSMSFSSVSEQLITGLNLLLSRYGIFTILSNYMPKLGKFKTVSRQYNCFVPVHYTYLFANIFTLTLQKKQERLMSCIAKGDHKFKRTIMNGVILDKVKSIEEVLPLKERVYDLTVEETRNFVCKNRLNVKDTFHSAGTSKANATGGVPRIIELLSVSRNPKNPSNVVYLDPSIAGDKNSAIAKMIEIQKTTLRDITKSVRIYYDPNPMSSDTVVSEDREILKTYEKFSISQGSGCVSPWVLRLELDPMEMASRNLVDMTLIQTRIANNKVLKVFECIHSDTNTPDKMIMRITFGSDTVKNALSLRFIEDKLLDTILNGVDGIGRAYIRETGGELLYDEKIGGYVSQKQHVLDVEGTNILDLSAIPNTDPYRTFSNDIHEVLDVFGIETARIALYEEFMEVFNSAYVNYHHMITLIDYMTTPGYILSADRSGMNKNEEMGVLAKSSFEETAKHLFNAAITADFDNMRGVSANIMFGQKPPCGTGIVDILVDETKLPEGSEEDLSVFANDLESANAKISEEDEKHNPVQMEQILMDW